MLEILYLSNQPVILIKQDTINYLGKAYSIVMNIFQNTTKAYVFILLISNLSLR